MTANLYEWVLQRRRNWKEEGRQEALQEAQQQVREAQQQARDARQEAQLKMREAQLLKVQQAEQDLRKEPRERFLRAEFRREQIDKVLAADTLTAEEKVHLIGILNAV